MRWSFVVGCGWTDKWTCSPSIQLVSDIHLPTSRKLDVYRHIGILIGLRQLSRPSTISKDHKHEEAVDRHQPTTPLLERCIEVQWMA